MSALPKPVPDGATPLRDAGNVKEIAVEYDDTTETVSVTPDSVSKGTSVRFKNSKGKLTITFLSPTGKEFETFTDGDTCQMIIGGTYHFKCSFTGPDGTESPTSGGVIDVMPRRP